jgi:hypothetical protein
MKSRRREVSGEEEDYQSFQNTYKRIAGGSQYEELLGKVPRKPTPFYSPEQNVV